MGDPLLLGGDFNLVNDPLLDHSSRPLLADNALPAALEGLQNMLGLADVLQCVNSLSR